MDCTTTIEMRQHMTTTQSATTVGVAHSERPAANINDACVILVLVAIYLRLNNGHRRRPSWPPTIRISKGNVYSARTNQVSTDTMVHILLVDFSKAFDRVDHHILLIKINVPHLVCQML